MCVQKKTKETATAAEPVEKFTKTTVGFVVQDYGKNDKGKFVCTSQAFIAGDQVDYQDLDEKHIDPPKHEYQPFNMTL